GEDRGRTGQQIAVREVAQPHVIVPDVVAAVAVVGVVRVTDARTARRRRGRCRLSRGTDKGQEKRAGECHQDSSHRETPSRRLLDGTNLSKNVKMMNITSLAKGTTRDTNVTRGRSRPSAAPRARVRGRERCWTGRRRAVGSPPSAARCRPRPRPPRPARPVSRSEPGTSWS